VHPRMPGLADLAFGGLPPRVTCDGPLVGRGWVLVPGLPDLGLGGGRRAACLPVGASVAWAWATPVRVMAASRVPSIRADASLDLDMGASDQSMGELAAVGY
jgi:hypothetical protein